MTAEVGILSFGAYIPKKRLQRAAIHCANSWFAPGLAGLAKGERAIGDWDEDSVTMAVEAARDTLIGVDRSQVKGLTLASTTLPFIDRLNSGIVKEALTLPDAVAAMDVTGSQRAGTSSLIQMLCATKADGASRLCLASEMRKTRPASEGELMYGDAAAGLLVGSGKPVARFLGSHSVTMDFVDHYRSANMTFEYWWESRWVRDEAYTGMIGAVLKDGLAALNLEPTAIDQFIVPVCVRGVPEALAKRAGIKSQAIADTLISKVGDAGVAHPILLLVAALERARAGEKILLVGFGQGVDLLLLETTEALEAVIARAGVKGSVARGVSDDKYLRWLFHRGLLQLDRGMRAELDQKQPGTSLWRHRKAVLGLVGGRCTKTGAVQFPRTDISVDPKDHPAHTQEDYYFAERRARVVTFTADNLTYSPNPPCLYGMIDFEGGGRLTVEFADALPEQIEVGCEMQMMFRIKAIDERRDFTKYFWKAAPVG
jgi:hydroxymethylglutaryl-CoA synthase